MSEKHKTPKIDVIPNTRNILPDTSAEIFMGQQWTDEELKNRINCQKRQQFKQQQLDYKKGKWKYCG